MKRVQFNDDLLFNKMFNKKLKDETDHDSSGLSL